MSKPFLPLLKDNNNIQTGSEGEWYPGNPLGDLADAIRLDFPVTGEIIHAIPTIWARPLLFHDALRRGQDHPLHNYTRIEWKALLAVICFNRVLNVPLGITEFQVVGPELKEYPKSLQKTVRYLRELSPGQLWNTLQLIEIGEGADKHTIGCTSPLTGVFTPAEYTVPATIPWTRNGVFIDPMEYLQFDTELRLLPLLAAWLERLIHDWENVDGSEWLRMLLRDWRNEIKPEALKVAPADVKLRTDFVLNANRLELRPLEAKDGTSSDFIMAETERTKASGISRPIIWSTRLTEDKLKDKILVNGRTWSAVKHPGDAKGDTIESVKNSFWICPEKLFFTDKLLQVGGDRLPHVFLVEHEGKHYLPPLNPEVLNYFTPRELEKSLRKTASGGEIELSFKIPIGNGGSSVEVRKKYRPDDVLTIDRNPILEIWPDFAAANWKSYYTLIDSTNTLEGLEYGLIVPSGAKQIVKNGNIQVMFSEKAPEGIEFTYMNKAIGTLLLSTRQAAKASTDKVLNVSVDFGTSHTQVFYDCGERISPRYQEICFSSRCLQLLKSELITRNEVIEYNFFPAVVKNVLPLVTNVIKKNQGREPVRDGLIVFDHNIFVAQKWSANFSGDIKNLRTNLKWSTKGNDRNDTHAFLNMLLMMIMAEAVDMQAGTVEIKWAYPAAFQRSQLEELKNMWSAASQYINERVAGLKLNVSSTPLTESLAGGKYWAGIKKRPASRMETALVSLDIGGGTSDIAVWCGKTLRAQTSIILGGRDVLRLFRTMTRERSARQDELVKELCKAAVLSEKEEETEYIIEALNQPEEDVFTFAFQNLLFSKGPEIVNEFSRMKNQEPPVLALRTCLFLMFAGLFYHLGQIFSKINSDNKLDTVDIYLCGNGSNFIRWIAPLENGTIDKVMARVFTARHPHIKNVNIHLTEEPKKEVALGLLSDYDFAGGNQQEIELFAGEKFRLGGKEQGIMDTYDFDKVTGLPFEAISCEELKDFIRILKDKSVWDGKQNILEVLSLDAEVVPAADRIETIATLTALMQKVDLNISQGNEQTAMVKPLFIFEVENIIEKVFFG